MIPATWTNWKYTNGFWRTKTRAWTNENFYIHTKIRQRRTTKKPVRFHPSCRPPPPPKLSNFSSVPTSSLFPMMGRRYSKQQLSKLEPPKSSPEKTMVIWKKNLGLEKEERNFTHPPPSVVKIQGWRASTKICRGAKEFDGTGTKKKTIIPAGQGGEQRKDNKHCLSHQNKTKISNMYWTNIRNTKYISLTVSKNGVVAVFIFEKKQYQKPFRLIVVAIGPFSRKKITVPVLLPIRIKKIFQKPHG